MELVTEEAKNSYKARVQEFAERLSKVIEERFVFEVKSGEQFIPVKMGNPGFQEMGTHMLEVYLDYLFGTAVAITATYCSSSVELEENIVAMVRDKFVRYRKMQGEGLVNAEHQLGRLDG